MNKQEHRILFSANRRRKPGPTGASAELIHAVVEMKQRNLTPSRDQIERVLADPVFREAQATFGNKSLKPTRSEVRNRIVRFVDSAALVTWTETPFPSGNGSETISTCWPYKRM